MDDLLDNAQIAINDAATQAGGPPPPPPPPPTPEPAKKRPIGILITTFLFLAGTVVFGARIIGQQRQIAEIRTSAATDPCKECNSSKKCVKTDKANCGPSLNECAVDADCQGVARPTPTPKSEGPSWRIQDGKCVKYAGAGMTLDECQAKLKKSTLCPYSCVTDKSKCTGENLGLGYGDCQGVPQREYCCQTAENSGGGGGGGGGGGNGDGGGGKAACRDIKIYKGDTEVDPSTLKAGDAVVLALKGLGKPTKGRFRVNGSAWSETSTKNDKSEFTLDFTIPEGVSKFTIEGELFVLGKWR